MEAWKDSLTWKDVAAADRSLHYISMTPKFDSLDTVLNTTSGGRIIAPKFCRSLNTPIFILHLFRIELLDRN